MAAVTAPHAASPEDVARALGVDPRTGLTGAFRATPLDIGQWLLVAVIALAPAVLADVVRSRYRTLWVA